MVSSTLWQDSNSPTRDHKTAKEDYFAARMRRAQNTSHRRRVGGTRDLGAQRKGRRRRGGCQRILRGCSRGDGRSWRGAVAGASRAVSENVVKPGMEQVANPELRAQVGGYVSTAWLSFFVVESHSH